MTVDLYTISDDARKLNKTLGSGTTLTCELVLPSDMLAPTIRVSASSWSSSNNYMYISTFGRYYFITEATYDNGGAVIIHGKVDPLKTYASSIAALTVNVVRQENAGMSKIVDNQITLTPEKTIEVLLCDASPFNVREQVTEANYVLVVAGGEQGE